VSLAAVPELDLTLLAAMKSSHPGADPGSVIRKTTMPSTFVVTDGAVQDNNTFAMI